MEIMEATLGKENPDYFLRLNNVAGLLSKKVGVAVRKSVVGATVGLHEDSRRHKGSAFFLLSWYFPEWISSLIVGYLGH